MKFHLPSLPLLLIAGLGSAVACTGQPREPPGGAGSGTQSGGLPPAANGGSTGMPPIAGATTSGDPGAAAAGTPVTTTGTGGVAAADTGGVPPSMGGTAGTPGASGTGGAAAEPDGSIGKVTFPVPSGTFEGSVSVTMTAAIAGLDIRYTTDGLLPTASSTLYDGAPLALSETTQLRAQLFDAGVATGVPSTAIYIRRTFDVTSDIPLIIMEGYGGGKPPTQAGPEKVIFRDLAFMLFEPIDGMASISAVPTWASRAGYHVRGQSSANFEKTPYRVELWDDNDMDADYPMIGMHAESDWAMVGPYTDKTLVRNAFVYSLAADIGLAALEIRFAEVYLNQDEGPLEAEDYQGVYAVTETVKNNKGRVDLKQLRPGDKMEPDISGGYIFKFDQAALREDEGEIEIPCIGGETCFADLELTDPVNPNAEQLAWIQSYIQQTHDALLAEPFGGYQFLDLPSFVDQFIINEITKGGDKYVRSVYMHKDRDGLIKAGPVWDYNFTLNNFTPELEGWQVEDGPGDSSNWFKVLFAQPEFMVAAAARWRELRPGVLSDAEIQARIDTVSAPLVNAGPRDLERWPVGEGSDFFGGGGNEDAPTTWEGQIADLKQWIKDRMAWLDAQFAEF